MAIYRKIFANSWPKQPKFITLQSQKLKMWNSRTDWLDRSTKSSNIWFFPNIHYATSFYQLYSQISSPQRRKMATVITGITLWSRQCLQKKIFHLICFLLRVGKPICLLLCCSVAKSCLTLCDPVDYSTPGFPVLPHLPKLARLRCIESVMLFTGVKQIPPHITLVRFHQLPPHAHA